MKWAQWIFVASVGSHAQAAWADIPLNPQPALTPAPSAPALSRLEPLRSETWLFPRSSVGVSIFHERLTQRTGVSYTSTRPGFAASFDQNIRSGWSGGLGLSASFWDPTTEAETEGKRSLQPLRVVSRLEYAPAVLTFGENKRLRWVGTAGLGYLFFSEGGGEARKEEGEVTVEGGTGLRWTLSQVMAIRLTAQGWRGVKTFSYTAQNIVLELRLGDMEGW